MWITKVKEILKLLPSILSLVGGNRKKREELELRVTELERRVGLVERLSK